MPHQRTCLVFLSGWTACSALTVILLTLHPCTGQSQDKPPQLVATVGDDIILPCYLKLPMDASEIQSVWARPDMSPGYVHEWEKNKERLYSKLSSYMGRTSLSTEKMKHGDISLNISQVKLSDEGTYSCLVPSLRHQSFVQLIVGSVSTPVIKVTCDNSSMVVLQCESKGWYPEPEVFWLDGEGNLLSAGPTETVRGPDDLYTVSSRVTVEKRHSNNFTCKVQQNNINQIREAHVIVQGDFFMEPFSVGVIAVCTVCFMFILTVVIGLSVLYWRQNKIVHNETTMHQNDEQTQQENNNATFINGANLDVKEIRDQTTVELLEYDKTPNDSEKDPKEMELLQKKEQTETQDRESARSESVRQNEKNERSEKKTRKVFCYK